MLFDLSYQGHPVLQYNYDKTPLDQLKVFLAEQDYL